MRFMVAIVALLFGGNALAEGSVTFDDADHFLKEAPQVREYVFDTLCVQQGGMAVRVGSEYPLAGKRIGPYSFYARRKNGEPHSWFIVKIQTSQRAFDRAGKPIGDDVPNAYRIEERFVSVEIVPAREPIPSVPFLNCDEQTR